MKGRLLVPLLMKIDFSSVKKSGTDRHRVCWFDEISEREYKKIKNTCNKELIVKK
jgi:hypothetical protein